MSNSTINNSIEISKIAKFCNMSRETILRFIEADYIKVLKREAGEIYVNANEACTLFGVNPKKLLDENQESTEKIKVKEANLNIVKKEIFEEEKILPKAKTEKVIVEINPSKSEDKDSENSETNTLFKRLNELQEQLLKKQDVEIEDLKSQRKWLQTRIEVLEQKLDREQLLLLSQTQVVNQLIKRDNNKPSPLKKALSWFGIEKQEDSKDNVVEMKSKKDVA